MQLCSYGENNYGHPSDFVKGELFANGVIPYDVTKDQNTLIIQTCRL